jgi:hypothetical protein
MFLLLEIDLDFYFSETIFQLPSFCFFKKQLFHLPLLNFDITIKPQFTVPVNLNLGQTMDEIIKHCLAMDAKSKGILFLCIGE